jgi:hypothetical protein
MQKILVENCCPTYLRIVIVAKYYAGGPNISFTLLISRYYWISLGCADWNLSMCCRLSYCLNNVYYVSSNHVCVNIGDIFVWPWMIWIGTLVTVSWQRLSTAIKTPIMTRFIENKSQFEGRTSSFRDTHIVDKLSMNLVWKGCIHVQLYSSGSLV